MKRTYKLITITTFNSYYLAYCLALSCFSLGCQIQSSNNNVPCSDGLLPLEDPFLGDKYDVEEMFTLLSGQWSTQNESVQITIDGRSASFSTSSKSDNFLRPLRAQSITLNDTLSFTINETKYVIYWVFRDPKAMRLIATNKNNSIKGVSLHQIEKSKGAATAY